VKKEKKKVSNIANDDQGDDVSRTISISSSSYLSRTRKMGGSMGSSVRNIFSTKSKSKSMNMSKSESAVVVVQDNEVTEIKLLPPEEEPEDPIIPELQSGTEPEPKADAYAEEKKDIPNKPCFDLDCTIL